MTEGAPPDDESGPRPDGLSAKRADLLRIARRHFMTEGYAATRMEAVARDAAMSTATLYALFPSKSDLFAHVIDDAARDFAFQIAGIGAAGDDCREQLTAFALSYAQFMSQPFVRSVFRLVMAERRRFRETADQFFQRGRNEIGGVLMDLIQTQAARGALRIDQASWAAGQLMGMIEHPMFFVPMVTGDEVRSERSPESIAHEAVATFMARYGADQG